MFPCCDTGGMMNKYIYSTTIDLNANYINILRSEHWKKQTAPKDLNPVLYDFLDNDPRNLGDKYFAELYDDTFLHYRAGGNCDKIGKELHTKRVDLMCDTLIKLCKEQRNIKMNWSDLTTETINHIHEIVIIDKNKVLLEKCFFDWKELISFTCNNKTYYVS